MIKRVYLESLGCRLNAAELEELARQFEGVGCVSVGDVEEADLIALNTCAVTASAAHKSRRRLRRLHRQNPSAPIAVLGCWVTEAEAEATALSGVAFALPNADKGEAVERITGKRPRPAPWQPGRWGHTRAFVAVQHGCDSACTYCVTRLLRGPARSRPLDEVLAVVRERVAGGAQEVVLTGVSLGAYGRDLSSGGSLAALVDALLAETRLPRLRLSSVEPWDVDEGLLRRFAHPRVCRQLHLPLQSGSDAILRRMGRPITTRRFAALVKRARELVPSIAVTTDVIVGFPGETGTEFEESLEFAREMALARLHVFPYSERAGTPARRLSGQIPEGERRERATRARALGCELSSKYRKRFVGKTLPVLWEGRNSAGLWRGWTDNYLSVVAETQKELYNRITATRLLRGEKRRVLGEPFLPGGRRK
jgi:threonylcarbamoyladenosine tRNA methylthiotransferase MtaB